MLFIRANKPLRISRGIFVYGEIIQMHTIHESNYTIIKLHHVMERVKKSGKWAKKMFQNILKITIQFIEAIKHNYWDRCT